MQARVFASIQAVAKMENEDRKYSLAELESYTYRFLQQMAKSMGLPSNVKKMYLVQMINAKKFKTKEELDDIVLRVKQERKQLSQTKKKGVRKKSFIQGPEISSTSNSLSPPISMTPKRPGHIVIRCSPENIRQAIAKYNAKHSYLTRNATSIRKTYPSPKKSDRILRSFNVKTTKNIVDDTKMTESSPKPSFNSNNVTYNSFGSLNNSVLSVLRPQNVSMTKEIQQPRILKRNLPENCIVKYKPVVSRNTFGLDPERSQLIPATRDVGTVPMVPAKRRRVLSGIYPIIPKEPPKVNFEYLHSVGFRRQDGKIAKINALVQKRVEIPQNIEVTVQDIINCSITQTFSNPEHVNTENTCLTYSHINLEDQRQKTIDLKDERHESTMHQGSEGCDTDDRNGRYDITTVNGEEHPYSVYYHKKIRGEQVRSQRRSSLREVPREIEERLPKINDVFSRFNAHTDVTQPIYVQVSEEADRFQNYPIHVARTTTNLLESLYNFRSPFIVNQPLQQIPTTTNIRFQNYPIHVARTNTNLLESLYNFRSPFIVNQPLQQIPTTTNTRCVYSTPVIATAMAQQSVALVPEFTASSCERDNIYYADLAGFPRISELLRFGEQQDQLQRDFRCDEELSTSCSSMDETTSQDLGATVTIPEMVEDALELISQDGDYMERIGMDVRVQCVICSFVCPKFLLEYHLRKEHSNDIHLQERNSWSMSFTLGSLVRASSSKQWSSRLLSHDGQLYVLAVTYDDSDCLHATLNTLTTDTNLPKSGSITIYNKVSGEPYAWEGDITPLPHHLPYANDTQGLTVQVAKLDLLPNSANLKLLNGELVLKSPTKVVVGQPELNDIHVILFVKIFN